MISKSLKSQIIKFAKIHLSSNDQYHSFKHALTTARFALKLARMEKTDEDVCWVSAILHDICKTKKGDHGVLGSEKASVFLRNLGFDKKFVEKVRDAIYYHNKEFRDGSLERSILWDADKIQVMSPYGYKTRQVPYWIMKLGKEKGKKHAASEYDFYFVRFHTDSAKKIVREYERKVKR